MVYDKNEVSLKTFNTAKKFVEEILFPLMERYQRFQSQSESGADKYEDAKFLDVEFRDIERYNGLKGMNDTTLNLLDRISSTVLFNKNKEEIAELERLISILKNIEKIFLYHKNKFFKEKYKTDGSIETLNIDYFLEIKEIICSCYINTEILMIRTKLLFDDNTDDYQTDEEIMKSIKDEYIDG